ncbi:MAG: hypothetical protein ACOYBY_08000 [Dermatophilaceae bacterium]
MKHRINGCSVNLRWLTDEQLEQLIDGAIRQQHRVVQEQRLLLAEQACRKPAANTAPELGLAG